MSLTKKILFTVLLVGGLVFLLLFKDNNPIKITNNIHFTKENIKLNKEISYILEDVEFRGYVFNKNGIEVWYIDKYAKEHFLTLNISKKLLNVIKSETPKSCAKDSLYIDTDYFKLTLPSRIKKQDFFCFESDKEFFIFSAPNEGLPKNTFLSYISIKSKELK